MMHLLKKLKDNLKLEDRETLEDEIYEAIKTNPANSHEAIRYFFNSTHSPENRVTILEILSEINENLALPLAFYACGSPHANIRTCGVDMLLCHEGYDVRIHELLKELAITDSNRIIRSMIQEDINFKRHSK